MQQINVELYTHCTLCPIYKNTYSKIESNTNQSMERLMGWKMESPTLCPIYNSTYSKIESNTNQSMERPMGWKMESPSNLNH